MKRVKPPTAFGTKPQLQSFSTLSKDSTVSTGKPTQFQIGRTGKRPACDRPAGIWDHRDITNSKGIVDGDAFAEEDVTDCEQPDDEFEISPTISAVGTGTNNEGPVGDKRWILYQDKTSELPGKLNAEAEAEHVRAMERKKALESMQPDTLMPMTALLSNYRARASIKRRR